METVTNFEKYMKEYKKIDKKAKSFFGREINNKTYNELLELSFELDNLNKKYNMNKQSILNGLFIQCEYDRNDFEYANILVENKLSKKIKFTKKGFEEYFMDLL